MDLKQFQLIKISSIKESKTNPRKSFEDKPLKELADNIKSMGVLQPILVRPLKGAGRLPTYMEQYEIVAGARRFRASKLAGIETIPARVQELTDEQAMEIQIIENLQRVDINPLDEAEGFQALIDTKKYNADSLADKIGKSKVYVYQRLNLNNLSKEAMKLLAEEKMTVTHAIIISRLNKEQQAQVLEDLLFDYGDSLVSISELKDQIARNIYMSLNKAPFSKIDENLNPKMGACINCRYRTGSNPNLFNDLGKEDHCLNAECYKEKIKADIKRKFENAEAEGYEPKYISDYYSSNKSNDYPGMLFNSGFEVTTKKGCSSVTKGIYVEGFSKIGGEVAFICCNPKCKVHGSRIFISGGSSGSSSGTDLNKEWRARQKREAFNRKVSEQADIKVLKLLMNKSILLDKNDYIELLEDISFTLDDNELAVIHGCLDAKDYQSRFTGSKGKSAMQRFSLKQLQKMVKAVMVAKMHINDQIKILKPKGIDIKQIEKDTRKELKEKEEKPKKKSTTKKVVKKKTVKKKTAGTRGKK